LTKKKKIVSFILCHFLNVVSGSVRCPVKRLGASGCPYSLYMDADQLVPTRKLDKL